MRRLWTILLVSALSLSGVAVAAEALITTDEDEVDHFLDDVTHESLAARLDGALRHVDASAVPFRLKHDGEVEKFGAGEATDLADAVRHALSVFDSQEQSLLQHAVQIDGDYATVTTRIGDSEYEQTVVYDLVRHEKRWLVRSVRVL